jgi:Phospholipase D-like domain at C-terminus of MIT/Dynamin family
MSMLLVHELHDARDRILLLKQQLEQALEKELPAFRPFVADQIARLSEALNQAQIPDRYRVAVVGRFKVGKSEFVNKLADARLAGVDINPETAAISVFRYDTQARAEVALVSAEEWERLKDDHAEDPKNPEVKRFERFIHFNERPLRKEKEGEEISRGQTDLNALVEHWVEPGGKIHELRAEKWETRAGKNAFLAAIKSFTSAQEPLHYLVNTLTIYAPIPILRDQIELIDTPGLDDPEYFRVRLTEDLVKDVDAILFLTMSGASYSQSDKEFILSQLRRRQIKHLQFIITKCDETFENAVRDARANDDDPPNFDAFRLGESSRVRNETKATLDELLQSNHLTDDEGYYFIEQLNNVPVHVVSARYHEDGEIEKGGIDAVRDGLYRVLSTSNRFEQARSILCDRLAAVLERLRGAYSERLNTLEREFDAAKVREQIESIRTALSQKLDSFGERSGEVIGLLANDQEALLKVLPVHLDVIALQAKEVLGELEKSDLIKHWKTRRCGYWGTLSGLQNRIADRVFPKVEAVLNEFRNHLAAFMDQAERQLAQLQSELGILEAEHNLAGLEPIALAAAQTPLFEDLRRAFQTLGKQERDGIILKLDDFVTEEVQKRLDQARSNISGFLGRGTTVRQAGEVSRFYDELRKLLADALRVHLSHRIREFAGAIRKNAESVVPRIREASENVIRQRSEAIASSLQVAAEGQKEQVADYLSSMVAILRDFAASPAAISPRPRVSQVSDDTIATSSEAVAASSGGEEFPALREQHYEIPENAIGFTYERIFRPYIDGATTVFIEEPFLRLRYQVDNFARFCALAIRCGDISKIELVSRLKPGDNTDDADSGLETLKRDLNRRGIDLAWRREPTLHDREIRFDNGWSVKIGRGLDIYLKPESWVEAADFSLRRCKQTKVDIYRNLGIPR